jgi:hypothetical protein
MPTDSDTAAGRKPEARTKVSNRVALFAAGDIDERSVFSRRLYDLLAAHVGDLGGWDNVSEAQASIARRAAILTIELEHLETEMARNNGAMSGNTADLYSRLSGQLRRLLETLGIERKQKTIASSLDIVRSLGTVPQRPNAGAAHE